MLSDLPLILFAAGTGAGAALIALASLVDLLVW
jgi:hypothetical protein